ncbi:MAG: hypothetical protein CO119_00240 [Flavobacteriales bacterium CG_4_9_14_3_um_filter_40_17]|nr:MAG: hypothetical protein CO119_00240 [Flavobacteriales bacterium CG_4_9_14_3_um_filter_40_17]
MDEHLIATHQEAAYAFLMFLYIAGMFSLIGFWASWQKKAYAKIITLATVGCLVAALYFALQAGVAGGEIRHPEIR